MDNPGYVTLSRQAALMKDMRIVANNIANLSTTGFRREGAVFSEMLEKGGVLGGAAAQTDANVRVTDFSQGALRRTGADLDLAIEGDGFFMVETPDGPGLTRAGAFVVSRAGELVNADGRRVLDEGAAAIAIPPDAGHIGVASDGTISVDGQPIGKIGVARVEDPSTLVRNEAGIFTTDQPLVPAEGATVHQGFVESSNVDPIREIARMIEVQRAYELGQSFLETEDERIRAAIRTLGAA